MEVKAKPENCTTCLYHEIHYDGLGFDGCTCSSPNAPKTSHRFCDEFCADGFDTERDNGECKHYKAYTSALLDGDKWRDSTR